MKRPSLFIIMLLMVIPGMTQTTFFKSFSITGNDNGISAIQTKDGGYIVFGSSYDDPDGLNYFLLKTGPLGDSLWVKKFPGDYSGPYVNGEVLLETPDSGFLFTTLLNNNLVVLKTDRNGDTIWTKRFPEIRYATIQPSVDTGYLICGGSPTTPTILIKIDPDGNQTWKKEYATADSAHVLMGYHSLKQDIDGSIIISGNIDYQPSYFYTGIIFLLKVGPTGDSIWYKTYNSVSYQYAATVQYVTESGYLVSGDIDSLGQYNYYDGLLMYVDLNGETLWTRVYGGEGKQHFNSFEKTMDGNFVACGTSIDTAGGNAEIFMVKMNAAGDTIWTRLYQDASSDLEASSIRIVENGGFIIAGSVRGTDIGSNKKVVLIKSDAKGIFEMTGADEHVRRSHLDLFPNPTNGIVNVTPPEKSYVVDVLTVLGKTVLQKKLNPNENRVISLDLNGNPAGIYLVRVSCDSGIVIGKVVLK